MKTLILDKVMYYTGHDEDAFFWWLKQIKSIIGMAGFGTELHLYFKSSRISRADCISLIALFKRYECDLDLLKIFPVYDPVEKFIKPYPSYKEPNWEE